MRSSFCHQIQPPKWSACRDLMPVQLMWMPQLLVSTSVDEIALVNVIAKFSVSQISSSSYYGSLVKFGSEMKPLIRLDWTRLDQIRPDHTNFYQTRMDHTRLYKTIPDQTRLDQTRLVQTRLNHTRLVLSRPDQIRLYQAWPNQTRPDQIRPGQTLPVQTRLMNHIKPESDLCRNHTWFLDALASYALHMVSKSLTDVSAETDLQTI